MASTVTGNVGGASTSGALVQASPVNAQVNNNPAQTGPNGMNTSSAVADGSGNYSISLAAGTYLITATLAGVKYPNGLVITVDGTTALSGINLSSVALTASNQNLTTGAIGV